MSRPEIWNRKILLKQNIDSTGIWCTPSVREKIRDILPYEIFPSLEPLSNTATLIVVGGGTLIDEAKLWRIDHAPSIKLVAVPSIWGSGAEISPIAVVNRDGKKKIKVDVALLPDARVTWPELGESVPPLRAREACGDCWAHALEGFLSPLADNQLKGELADLINKMLDYPLAYDPEWFELSAKSCSGQARSSVGLVHGIAHSLEGPLRAQQPNTEWGHAKLCSNLLWPVIEFNRQSSDRWQKLTSEFGIDSAQVISVLRDLFNEDLYDQILPIFVENWRNILRDPCSRTNCALVRPAQLDFFNEKRFS